VSGSKRVIAALALIVAAGAAFAIAFTQLGGSGSSESSSSNATATTPAEQVVREAITVDANGPVGGVAEISARAGQRIVITVASTGYTGEIHLHGFNVKRDIAPGKPVVFVIAAAQTRQPQGQGSFEMELEATSTQIAKLLISP
jgi:hypothetical protein